MSRIVIGASLAVALAATVACGGSSPSSPSATLSAAPPSTTVFAAQPLAAAGAQAAPLTTLSSHGHSGDEHGHGRESQLEGAIVSIDTVHKTFVVGTTTVNVLDTTTIRHGHTTLTFADLKVGQQVHVKGAPNGAAIDARAIFVQNDGHPDDDTKGEAEGTVSALAGTCPSITFNLGTLKVATNATTVFRHGACADVANGGMVEVKGAIQTDGSLLAARVSLAHEGDDEQD